MEEDLYDKFKERWPKMFTDVECGFWLPAGWEQIVWDLCEKIEPLVDDEFRVAQVKEKFGGLRFYVGGGSDEVDKLIGETEGLSFETCQSCGLPGTRGGSGWIVTLCKSCGKDGKA